jgi:hypothetical protein
MSKTYRDNFNAKTKKYRREGLNVRGRFQRRRCDNKGSGFVGCSCWACQAGIHADSDVLKKIRANRHSVRQSLRQGKYDVAPKFSVGYTD